MAMVYKPFTSERTFVVYVVICNMHGKIIQMNVDKTEKTSVKNSLLNKKNMKTKQNRTREKKTQQLQSHSRMQKLREHIKFIRTVSR